ncbi:hypothetical protein M407DRAFT_245946 [Tulasnella calospora MUT 4182]|uniref:Uncharacterized protein n=1 Tax=Tulasnella calospora MUT 4182 TaxID=1051891 RepID=A0A0C3Q7P3_9AGAM|nr:hypothetical protein M407DRAFT_245946 [Tulasnella calospora MUT 4182]
MLPYNAITLLGALNRPQRRSSLAYRLIQPEPERLMAQHDAREQSRQSHPVYKSIKRLNERRATVSRITESAQGDTPSDSITD